MAKLDTQSDRQLGKLLKLVQDQIVVARSHGLSEAVLKLQREETAIIEARFRKLETKRPLWAWLAKLDRHMRRGK